MPGMSKRRQERNGGGTATARMFRRYHGRQLRGTIAVGDALLFLQSMRTDAADVIFLDPPFNLGKTYCRRRPKLDIMLDSEYAKWFTEILIESTRVLRQGGTLYLYHLPVWALRFGAFLDGKLSFKHWIAISMKNGFIRGRRLYPAHYALLMFTKGDPLHFSRPKLALRRCRHCGEYIKDYGGYLPIVEARGINLSDFWEDLSPVRHASRKHRRANELPELLFERVIEISGSPDSLYVDPFAGTGSGVIAAARRRMRFAACDLVAANCRLVENRLDLLRKELAREE
jgi:site-specific DNA-methyltransferase (adenine-specific)